MIADRIRLAAAGLALALLVGLGAKMAAQEIALTKARASLREQRAAVAQLSADLKAERRAAAAAEAALAVIDERDERARPIVIQAREEIARAENGADCVRSPAVRASLDGVLRLEAGGLVGPSTTALDGSQGVPERAER